MKLAVIGAGASRHPGNLWWATAGPRDPVPALGRGERADVVVVGAGIMGAAAALRLSEKHAAVAIVEAGEVGEGASSRPGGFVVPHFSVGNPSAIVERTGAVGERLVQAVGGSAAHVFGRIAEYGIACDARQGGWYYPAPGAAAFDRVSTVAREWAEAGFPGELIGANETTRRTGTDGYVGSWYAPTGGTIHPLMYCRGMVDAAIARGARLYENSPVRKVERIAGGFRVSTKGGSIEAKRVIVCTNGKAAAISPTLAGTIVPLSVWQCATEPMAPEEIAHLFANGECLSDTRRNLFTYRIDPMGRIITGAMHAFGITGATSGRMMARRLKTMLDLPRVPRIDYLWTGTSSVSAGRLPATIVEDDGVVSATACNARGIALSTVVGEALADHALGGPPPPVPVLVKGARSNAGLQSALRGFYPHMAPLLDWIEERR